MHGREANAAERKRPVAVKRELVQVHLQERNKIYSTDHSYVMIKMIQKMEKETCGQFQQVCGIHHDLQF